VELDLVDRQDPRVRVAQASAVLVMEAVSSPRGTYRPTALQEEPVHRVAVAVAEVAVAAAAIFSRLVTAAEVALAVTGERAAELLNQAAAVARPLELLFRWQPRAW
jgi:hypothetical protein